MFLDEERGQLMESLANTDFISSENTISDSSNSDDENSEMKSKSLSSKSKLGFYVPFNSQGHIGTGPQNCHLWDSNPQR